MRLKIESLEQQLRVLKSKVSAHRKGKSLSDLYGIFEGRMDLSLEEIEKYEYSFEKIIKSNILPFA